MQDDWHIANFAKSDCGFSLVRCIQFNSITVLTVSEAIVPPVTLETGIAWSFTTLDAAEVSLESQVKSDVDVLQT